MKYAYATVALPTLTPAQAIEQLTAAGYRGVEWKVGEAPHAIGSSAERFLVGNRCTLPLSIGAAAQVQAQCAAADLAIVGLGPYLKIGDVATLRTVIEMAKSALAPQIRLQAARMSPGGETYQSQFGRTTEYLQEAASLARDAGVRVVVEIHQSTIAPSASLAHRLVSQFDPTVIGVIYDIGNLVFEGYEDPRIAIELLGPYLQHVHLKNAAAVRPIEPGRSGRWRYVWSALDDGLADVPRVLDLLHESGYEGWVSLEDLSTVRDPSATLRHNAEVLRAMPSARWADDQRSTRTRPGSLRTG